MDRRLAFAGVGLLCVGFVGAAYAWSNLFGNSSGRAKQKDETDATVDFDAFTTFDEAVDVVNEGSLPDLSTEQQLVLYGLYKRASTGAAPNSGHAARSFVEAAKQQAWQAVSHLSQAEAKQAYMTLVRQLLKGEDGDYVQRSPGVGPGAGAGAGPGGGTGGSPSPQGGEQPGMEGMGSGYSSRPVQEQRSAEEVALDPHACARDGDAASLRALLASHPGGPAAVVHARNEAGETPLHAAADSGNVATIAVLLSAGADANACESEAGQSALHYACCLGHTQAAVALVQGGADVSQADADGNTAWDVAEQAVIAQLKDAGVVAPA